MSTRLLLPLLLLAMLIVGLLIITAAFRRRPSPPDTQERACSHCGRSNEPAARYCAACGKPL